ncbi:Hypothetical predicted protein, partial [Podarcis lilfordi]
HDSTSKRFVSKGDVNYEHTALTFQAKETGSYYSLGTSRRLTSEPLQYETQV